MNHGAVSVRWFHSFFPFSFYLSFIILPKGVECETSRAAFSSQIGQILKVPCYRNYFIDFNQTLHNDGDHQEVVVGSPNRRPRIPRWRTAAILKKNPVKSPYLCNRLTDFDEIGTVTYISSLQRWYYSAWRWHSGDVMVGNITFLMIFAAFDPSPLTLWINCSF